MNLEPAFPVLDLSKTQCHGMSLRDYFAAKAMQALLHACADAGQSDERVLGTIPSAAYQMADAMLKARES